MPDEALPGRAAPSNPATGRAKQVFKSWFWRPPRAHGETIVDRRVSPLELLYDLVYAAVIAQAGNHLAAHVSAGGLIEFAAIFSLTWIAWANGSLYLELHGRSDGRTRTYFFLQIGILAILATYAADAHGSSGSGFAIAYTAFLLVMTWLWIEVRRRDAVVRPEFLGDTGRYVVAMVVSVVVICITAFLPDELRLAVWVVFTVSWIILLSLFGRSRIGLGQGMTPTDSLVERFGTITIIVLGEVVFGVVDGLSQSRPHVATIATGMIALVIGFGLWWIYFDVVGGRLPKPDGGALASWILSHYPITLAIAAAGAGMVSLIEHADDGSTPAATSWLLSGAVAVGLVFLIPTWRALADADSLAPLHRSLLISTVVGALVSVLIGWARPVPWLLALLLVVVLSAVWAVMVRGFAVAGVWGVEETAF
ncbi:MAG TPA: low temperature requirement protein A [Candidatus Limnocylindrales bacterium]|nr:low temperature requirement protein A [Candidatus Limnocylindrales bacterium]